MTSVSAVPDDLADTLDPDEAAAAASATLQIEEMPLERVPGPSVPSLISLERSTLADLARRRGLGPFLAAAGRFSRR